MVKEVFINYGYLLGVGRDNVSEGLMSMLVVEGGVKYFLIESGYYPCPRSYNHGLWMVPNVSV